MLAWWPVASHLHSICNDAHFDTHVCVYMVGELNLVDKTENPNERKSTQPLHNKRILNYLCAIA